MFLFTTPPTPSSSLPPSAGAGPVVDAIRQGAETTPVRPSFAPIATIGSRATALGSRPTVASRP